MFGLFISYEVDELDMDLLSTKADSGLLAKLGMVTTAKVYQVASYHWSSLVIEVR